MTKEQEEAIERLNNYKEYILKCGNKKSKHFKAVVTVLNMLKEKDKQLAKYEKIYKEYDCYRWVKELEKKDKIIDLMAERIEWLCKSNGILLDKEHDENFTQEDIKKYYERKVENGN